MNGESSVPDSWDDGDLNEDLQTLNVGAKPFVPNAFATPFVPKGFSAAAEQPAHQYVPPAEPVPVVEATPKPVEVVETSQEPFKEPKLDIKDDKEQEEVQNYEQNSVPEAEDDEDNSSQKSDEKSLDSTPKDSRQATASDISAPKKDHLNVVFIGHVDAGKSTIGGQIMFLTGMVDKRTLEKYEREAKEKNRETWYLSWVVDTNLEEREKGKTVEVGRAYFETETKHFTILDAPGHRSFVPNMIGGTSQADVAVLVISARRGEFETGFERGGQTREHAMLAKTAGVQHLIVLINKMDDPTVKWKEERYIECKEKLTPFLKKVGFRSNIHFMPCSGLTGANLMEGQIKNHPFYTGLPLIPYLDNLPLIKRSGEGPVRLAIVDKYKDMGIVVLGKLESGSISKGMYLTMQPNKQKVKILSVLSDDIETDRAIAGENVKLRIDNIDEDEVSKGFVLCSPDNLCTTGSEFDAQIVIIEYKSIICAGYSAIMHVHTCAEEVEIKQLLCLIDRKTGEKVKGRPRFVKQDQTFNARMRASGTICMESFKDFPHMGRFTLRDEGKTIAVGKILKVRN